MSDQELGFVLIGVAIGLVLGVLFSSMRERFQSGGVSKQQVQDEFDAYKADVEAHFASTSKKFQDVTEQYKDLYEHLSVGATTLCNSPDARPMFGKSDVDALLEDNKGEIAKAKKGEEVDANKADEPSGEAEHEEAKQPNAEDVEVLAKSEQQDSTQTKAAPTNDAPQSKDNVIERLIFSNDRRMV